MKVKEKRSVCPQEVSLRKFDVVEAPKIDRFDSTYSKWLAGGVALRAGILWKVAELLALEEGLLFL